MAPGVLTPGAPRTLWRVGHATEDCEQRLVPGAHRSEGDPGRPSIITHRDADVLKMAERRIELLLGEQDLRAGFRRAVGNAEKIGDGDQRVDPGAQA
jgi:hypothetical protein